MKKINYCLRKNHLRLMPDKSPTVSYQVIIVLPVLFLEIVKKQILARYRLMTSLFKTALSIKGSLVFLRLDGADEITAVEIVHKVRDRNMLCFLPDGDGDPRCMYPELANIS